MKRPTLDAAGKVIPHDHDEVANEDMLIRRIDPIHHVIQDDNLNCLRLSSKALQPSSEDGGGMSVDIEKLIQAAGHDPATYVTTPKYLGSIRFSAGTARDADLLVGYDPIPGNDCHGEIWGKKKPNRFSRSQQRAIAAASTWFVALPGVQIAGL